MRILSANFGIAALAFVGLAVAANSSGIPFYLFIFTISLLQAGLTVRAFDPVTGSSSRLTPAGKVAGWIGFIGWMLLHMLNGEIVEIESTEIGVFAVIVELAIYMFVNMVFLVPAYFRRTRTRRATLQRKSLDDARHAADRDRQYEEERHRASDQKRRDDARFACQLLYDRHRIELVETFPPGQLESYFQQYMGDERSAGEVEERAERLRMMLQEFLDGDGNGQPKFQNVIELREFYHQERLRIDESDLETDLKDTLLADLAQEEESAIREFRKR